MKKLFISVACVTFLVLAGCKEKDKYTLLFSHVTHVTDNKIECDNCHGKIKDGKLGRPNHEVCEECHSDNIKAKEISVKTCGMCHKEKDLTKIPKVVAPVPPPPRVFRHTDVLKKNCLDCHSTLVADKKANHVPPMSQAEILRIRQKAHASGKACDTCHTDMSPLKMPPSHDKAWVKRHGTGADDKDAVCGVCHSEDACNQCHRSTRPSSHNQLWKMKTHGIQASWERAKCLRCHEQDSCTACHSEMKPRSHNANWKNRHCENCHESESMGTGCATCHKNALKTHPKPHGAGWLGQHCGQCHAGSGGVVQCALCHQDAVRHHPNPHGAGWQTQHCNSCHPGTPEREQCIVCHGSSLQGHPMPHPAGWLNQHCTQCHAGTAGGDQCVMCHSSAVKTHPNPHAAGWRASHCNTCHLGTPEAGQCTVCHSGGLKNHPNPHAAGWKATHCAQCHNHALDTSNCGACHTGGHDNPHPVGWAGAHCYGCHDGSPGYDGCDQCHAGGSSLGHHNSVWPASHTTSGYGNGTDCFVSGCHDGVTVAGLRARGKLQQRLLGPMRPGQNKGKK